MTNLKNERLSIYKDIKYKCKDFLLQDIEDGIILYCLLEYKYDSSIYAREETFKVVDILKECGLSIELEYIIELFESLLEDDNISENGIVFTPKYISDYIMESAFEKNKKDLHNISIIDPGCGCGIFLLSAVKYLLSMSNNNIDYIIENNIYGIEIDKNNARRCRIILKLLSAKYGGNFYDVNPNIMCEDSLKINWNEKFNKDGFDYIIGNPPYVNPHDMNKDTVKFLKENFKTTKKGVFNIFYAFIEKSMKYLTECGVLGFIVPNNFLTIKSAVDLRDYLKKEEYVDKIIDFGDNMVFKPVRTYNCIILLDKLNKKSLEYYVMPKVEKIQESIKQCHFSKIDYKKLDKNGWKLIGEKTYRNISKIESKSTNIKDFIRTGIATLRDNVYLVNLDNNGYFKEIEGEKVYIESELVKDIYKIPELKLHDDVNEAKRYIIFPYVKSDKGYTLIDEKVFSEKYPKTYNLLLRQRHILDERDKGKGAVHGWYAYGRTQGLNKYGKKLLFPTFTNVPKFVYVENEDALFCNGYAVFENDLYELDILQRILNSKLMEYYVSNTSYSIEGGYYCYQKKYIEHFSLPNFTQEELDYIRTANKYELDNYLWNLYGLE